MRDSELNVPNPLKPKVRYQKPRQRLTTIIVVKCRDGIILCADGQQTANFVGGFGTKEIVTKLRGITYRGEVDRFCMMGCSGTSTYIDLFREHVGKTMFNRGNRSYFDVLDDGIRSYTSYIMKRNSEMGVKSSPDQFPEAIFAGYDPKEDSAHVYVLETPHPPNELSPSYHAAIGTGGLYANLLLSIAETAIDRLGVTWADLSTKLVGQFCYLILARVMGYDRDSGMNWYTIRVDETGAKSLHNEEVFPGHGTQEDYRLTVFVKTLLNELPKENLLQFAKRYNLLGIIAQNVGDLG